ncbi:Protein rnfH [Alloalcanivorax dieselolei B5]|uniref:UPF0125 protein B5T_03879 n=1 Tax=Alcanivorax dieselolei (strain DSM 16502 / CGMCC 1.3690 / MCCC 1A00001 / B-5) TaxID=930169 RepID=K0CKL9_ALCDB|nr:RnfH family protein [Alloalcanivorax dieselolei]AFT72141.1 Protein rnfH [Alloalcanivorax dieselolei B5]GGJ75529.1 UPF0125 protein [Alloalcanivorax dieselolei]
MAGTIRVEVVYALPEKQKLIAVEVPEGASMLEAVTASGIAEHFEGLDPAGVSMGVFGKVEPNPAGRTLAEGERVELYRPLKADPKSARRARARRASQD